MQEAKMNVLKEVMNDLNINDSYFQLMLENLRKGKGMLKAKMHGLSSIKDNKVKVQSEKLNLVGLIATFESNLDKQPQKIGW
ncbi:hypothetical protein AAAC51_06600 [Priestia megaterium]